MAHDSSDFRASVTVSVKWYNATKGFGFVQPDDGGSDAFLHASVAAASGHQDFGEGDVLTCDIAAGPRGAQVVAIHGVERSSQPPRAWHQQGHEVPGETVEGVVKFFDAGKGFGFILPDGGGKDIFVSARTLMRSGINELVADQRVRVTTRMGPKGPMAEDISLL